MRALLILTAAAILQGSLAVSLIGSAAGIARSAAVRNCAISGTALEVCQTLHAEVQ